MAAPRTDRPRRWHATQTAVRVVIGIAAVVLAAWFAYATAPTVSVDRGAPPPSAVTPASVTVAQADQSQHPDRRARHDSRLRGQEVQYVRPAWGTARGPAPSWDASPASLGRFVHLAGLLVGATLLLGGFHRGRQR